MTDAIIGTAVAYGIVLHGLARLLRRNGPMANAPMDGLASPEYQGSAEEALKGGVTSYN
jgi:hypothetical protein